MVRINTDLEEPESENDWDKAKSYELTWDSQTCHWRRGIRLIAAVSVVIHGSLLPHSTHINSPLTILLTPGRKLKVVVTPCKCLFVCSAHYMWHDTDTGPTLWEPVDQHRRHRRHVSPAAPGRDIGWVLWHVTSAPGRSLWTLLDCVNKKGGGFQNINNIDINSSISTSIA